MGKNEKLELIEELTTHKCDFKIWPLQPVQAKSQFKSNEEPVSKLPPPYVQIDPQSHAPYSPWVHVPFDLYLRPKPILGTDPRECFKISKSPDLKLNRELKKLSTLVAPDLSEIENQDDLRTILRYTYTGMHKILMEEAVLKVPTRKRKINAPNRVVNEGNDMRYKAILYQPLPPGWISAARHWDSLQSRNIGDPFKTFWTRRGPEVECGCCCNPLAKISPQETTEK